MTTRKDEMIPPNLGRLLIRKCRISEQIALHAGLVLTLLLVLRGPALGGTLGFPLTNDKCPTSSFGSWRAGHLHAGLDFSTGGVTGVPVLAVDSCWVWRVRLWNGGYGKALYTELSDGKIAVYGHLSGFIPDIESMVEGRQDIEGRYEVEVILEPGRFRFGPGDTLAFSGETGSGPPHLHFELRSGQGEHAKINPVPDFMNLQEGLDPVIKSVRISPLDMGSEIDGSPRPVRIRPDTGRCEVRISGPFGVSVEAVDPVQCGRILLPVSYEAWIDGIPIWKLDLDRFPFVKAHFVGGLYEIIGGSRFMRLFDPYNLDFAGFSCRKPSEPGEAGLLTPGWHRLSVRVADAWGNTDEVTLPFVYGSPPAFRRFHLHREEGAVTIEVESMPPGSAIELACRSGGIWRPVEIPDRQPGIAGLPAGPDSLVEVRCRLRGEWGLDREVVLAIGDKHVTPPRIKTVTTVNRSFVEIWAEASSPPSSLPVGFIRGENRMDSVTFQPAGLNQFRAAYVPHHREGPVSIESEFTFGNQIFRDSTELTVEVLEPGGEVWFSGEEYRVRLRAPGDYSSRTLISVSGSPGEVREGFHAVAGRLAVDPLDVFFNERVEVLIVARREDIATGYGVFAECGSAWSFRGRLDDRGRCGFTVQQPECFVIAQDTEAPDIDPVTHFRRRESDGKAVFISRIRDRGSGVDAGTLRALVDGQPAIVSVDPDTGRISGRTTKALPYGEHRIRLEAEDRMGNRAGREFTLDLSR